MEANYFLKFLFIIAIVAVVLRISWKNSMDSAEDEVDSLRRRGSCFHHQLARFLSLYFVASEIRLTSNGFLTGSGSIDQMTYQYFSLMLNECL
jgi:hypothetical protein